MKLPRSFWVLSAFVVAVVVAIIWANSVNTTGEAVIDLAGQEGDDDVTNAASSNGKLDPVQIVAAGIQHVEGWFPGSKSFRNKNPGNLRVTGATGEIGTDADGMAIFDTYEDGFDALLNDLEAKAEKHPTFSILDVFKRYAPSQDGNNPSSYASQIASDLSSALGIDVPVTTNWANLVNEYDGDSDGGDA